MHIQNEPRASSISQTPSAETEKDNSPSFKDDPKSLPSKVNEAIQEAAKAFGHVISAILGQTQPSQQPDSHTPKNAPKSPDLPHSGGNVHGGWDLTSNKPAA